MDSVSVYVRDMEVKQNANEFRNVLRIDIIASCVFFFRSVALIRSIWILSLSATMMMILMHD